MDYGKLAYAKTQELSRRISNISYSSGGQKTLSKTFYGLNLGGGNRGVNFYFTCLKRGEITINLYADALCEEDFSGRGIIRINSVSTPPFPISLEKDKPCFICASKRVIVNEGSADISFEIEGTGQEQAEIKNLLICASGEKLIYAHYGVQTLYAQGQGGQRYFAALWGASLQVFGGEEGIGGEPTLYNFERDAEGAKLFVNAEGLNCLYLGRGKLYRALLGEDGQVHSNEICGNISAFDYAQIEGEKYIYAVIRLEVYLLKLDAQYNIVSKTLLISGNKAAAVKCALRGQQILLAVQELSAIKLYLSQGFLQTFEEEGIIYAKGLVDLREEGDALLTKEGGIFYLHTLDGQLNASSSPLIYCENACFAQEGLLFSQENQLSIYDLQEEQM